MNLYPSDAELRRIRMWDVASDVRGLLEYVEDLWGESYGTFELTGKRVLRLHLVTGGWSGNEWIMDALRCNVTFWSRYWQKSERGGAYTFRIDTR